MGFVLGGNNNTTTRKSKKFVLGVAEEENRKEQQDKILRMKEEQLDTGLYKSSGYVSPKPEEPVEQSKSFLPDLGESVSRMIEGIKLIPKYFTDKDFKQSVDSQVKEKDMEAFSMIMRPFDVARNATVTGLKEAQDPGNINPIDFYKKFVLGAYKGATGQAETPTSELMPEAYQEWAEKHPGAAFVPNLVLDVAADPTTYLGGAGLAKIGKAVEKKAAKNIATGAAEKVGKEVAEDASVKAVSETAKQLQDEITTPNPEQSKKIAEELRGLSETQPTAKNYVSDSEGKPLTVYHGTNAEFDKFDNGAIGKRYGDKNGIFFSNMEDEALSEANTAQMSKGGTAKVYKANVTMENPLVINANDLPNAEYSYGHPVNSYDSSREYVKQAMNSGNYDGVIIKGTGKYKGNDMYIVKDAKQADIIKDSKIPPVADDLTPDNTNIPQTGKTDSVPSQPKTDSVIINKGDNVVELYHGGNTDPNDFDVNKASKEAELGQGFYATAESYAKEWAEERGGKVYPVKINTANFFDEKIYKTEDPRYQKVKDLLVQSGIRQRVVDENFGGSGAFTYFADKLAKLHPGKPSMFPGSELMSNIIKEAGFDGAIARFRDTKQYVSYANDNIIKTNMASKTDSGALQAKEGITPMSNRTVVAGVKGSVGDRTVKAYQFENPEVKPYFREYAEYILNNEYVANENLDRITDVMKKLKADTGLTPSEIKDALERLVKNQGQENVAAAKRVEIVIDDMLTNGFDSVLGGNVPPIKDYLDIKSRIEGVKIKPVEKTSIVDDLPMEDNFAKPVERNAVKADIGYHAGDLGKAEHFARFYGSNRDTGHFGTGTYFVGDKKNLNLSSYKDRPLQEVDLNGYNLFKPQNAKDTGILHDMLKYANTYYDYGKMKHLDYDEIRELKNMEPDGIYDTLKKYDSFDEDSFKEATGHTISDVIKNRLWNGDIGREFDKQISRFENKNRYIGYAQDYKQKFDENVQRLLGVSPEKAEEILSGIDAKINKLMEGKDFYSMGDIGKEDSISTRFMKALGYEGVDVRHIPQYDNVSYGTVVYDLKPTPKPVERIKDTDQIGISGVNVRTVKDSDGNVQKMMSPHGQSWKDGDGWKVQLTGQSKTVTVGSEKEAMAAIDSGMERTEVKVKQAVEDSGQMEIGEVPSAFKGAQPGELDYKPVNVGLQTQAVTQVPKGQTPPFKYADPELERVHIQNKGLRVDTLPQKVVKGITELKDMFTRPIKTLPVKGNEQLYYGRNGLINLTKARNKAGDETTRIITDITKEFKRDKNAFDMFQRKVLLDDLAQEVKLGNSLPNKWTPEAVTSELKRLDELMPDSVRNAIVKRNQHWKEVKDKYIKAMEDVGVNMEDRLTREDYFRHQVLDYMDMKNAVSGVGKKMQVPSNRGFTQGRSGEYVGDINTDYIQAEYEVMAQMLHDTEVANTIKFIDNNKNIVDKVKADAKAQGIEDWHKAIPEGYTTWQPREGNAFYMYKPVAEEIVEGALSLRGMTLKDIKDPKIKVILEDILNDLADQREVLAMGGKRKEFVIPQEVADTLNNMMKNQPTSIPAKFFQGAHTLWKRWILYLNPRNWFKYGTRNTVGDLDAVIAGNPSGLTKTLRSMTELADAMRNGNFTPELKSFYDMGGYQATQAAQEISEASKLKPFEAFRDNLTVGEKIAKPFKKYEEFMSDANAYREMVLRYGSYLDYLEQLNKGTLKNYGASKRNIIDALATNEEKAYKLADDLLGAYDDVSEAGKFLRRQFIPFYSWLETNFKRYNRLFANAVTTGDVGTAAKTAAGVGVKAGLSVTRKMAGIFTLTGVLAAWNHMKYADLEETLPEDVKSKPHLILGQDKDGNTIYFSRLGSLNDFGEWFGMDNAWQDGMDILNGKKTIMEQLKDMSKSGFNKAVTSVRPEIKIPVEYLSGKKFYPDVFDASNIRDKNQYLAQQFGLGNEYNQIFGKPSKSYESTIADIFAYKSNPEEAAYWNSVDMKNKYKKRKSGSSFSMDDKSMALYNYKLALRYDDKEAQEKYMKLYESYGGNPQQTIESVLSMSPYYGIPKDEIQAYKFSLTEKQKRSLKLAEDYFIDLLESELTSKRPLSDGTRAMLNIYTKTYETKQFPKIITNRTTYKGKEYKLTPEEVKELQERVNKKMYEKADAVVKNTDFKKKPYDKQAEILSNALNAVVEVERNKWKAEKYKK
jgi:hypothetical protein